ncbi:MAG TPA: hypothetical protein VHT30_05880 [Acidimicrobiales bacterium]|nr:hypothetical protein [Acidimicrobiales bacterium]
MKRTLLLASALTLLAGLIAACSSSKTASSATTTSAASTSGPGAFARAHYTTNLAGACPNPVVVQADWLPEADHGFLYQMIGGGGQESQYTYQGPLGSTGVNLEILSGGPGLGNGVSQPSSLYVGNLVKRVTPTLSFVSSDDAIQYSKQFPTTAVFAEYQKSPQVIMFDPSKYSIKNLADLKSAVGSGAKIYVESTTFSFVRWLIAQGIPSGAFIGGYSGDLEKFVGGSGSLLNQGFATNEVYTLEHLTPNWDKPVGYLYIADAGLPFYQSSMSVATSKLTQLAPCLKKLVPIMQHAVVDYVNNPTEVNTLLADFNNKGLGAAFWHTPVALNAAAAKIMVSDHLVADTPGTSSVGGFDLGQVTAVIHDLVPVDQSAGMTSLNPNVTAADIATNQFIDPSVGL